MSPFCELLPESVEPASPVPGSEPVFGPPEASCCVLPLPGELPVLVRASLFAAELPELSMDGELDVLCGSEFPLEMEELPVA